MAASSDEGRIARVARGRADPVAEAPAGLVQPLDQGDHRAVVEAHDQAAGRGGRAGRRLAAREPAQEPGRAGRSRGR